VKVLVHLVNTPPAGTQAADGLHCAHPVTVLMHE
jgi:hypothetical protein